MLGTEVSFFEVRGSESVKKQIQFLECSWNHEYFRSRAK